MNRLKSGFVAAALLATGLTHAGHTDRVAATEWKLSVPWPRNYYNRMILFKPLKNGLKELEKEHDLRIILVFPKEQRKHRPNDAGAVLAKIKNGVLQGAILPGESLRKVVPASRLYALPLMFRSVAEVDHVRKHLDRSLFERLKIEKLTVAGVMGEGFSYILSAKATKTVAELKKRQVWFPAGSGGKARAAEAGETYGLTFVPSAFEDLSRKLKDGRIDSIILLPRLVLLGVKRWYRYMSYMVAAPFAYHYSVLLVSTQTLNRLPDAKRAAVKDKLTRTLNALGEAIRKENDTGMKAMVDDFEVQLTTPGDDLQRWASEVSGKIVEAAKISAQAATLQKLLHDFRQAKRREGGQ